MFVMMLCFVVCVCVCVFRKDNKSSSGSCPLQMKKEVCIHMYTCTVCFYTNVNDTEITAVNFLKKFYWAGIDFYPY